MRIQDVSSKDIETMMCLMREYYSGIDPAQFERDFFEKDWAIVLRDEGGLWGFSTQRLFTHTVDGVDVLVVFSGDTVIHKSRRRSGALPVAWASMMRDIAGDHPDRRLFWMLTTKGYKTYRYLSVFFREYYPALDQYPPPFVGALAESLGNREYGGRFDPERWIIRASADAQRLRPGVASITTARRRDPHVAFFERANPDHARGDELLCLAEWSSRNLCPYIRKRIEA